MKILLTGAAGFVGFHTAKRFLERGDTVVGIDNLNSYYAPTLKQARLSLLHNHGRFEFHQADVADPDALSNAVESAGDADLIVHFAAQAGVRYSIENPYSYVSSNVTGQVAILELVSKLQKRPPVVYASSSSVYGSNEKVPFCETDPVVQPVSVYAATKRAAELLAATYRDMHGLRSTGLRFFTVYGRYGRPDMAPWLFTEAILRGEPISVFNNGDMQRDFTHVDDIAAGAIAAADRILADPENTAPIYNLGNNQPVRLMDFIAAIETATGRRARKEMKPKPPGDVLITYANIDLAARDLGFAPKVRLDDGIADFVEWFRGYNGIG